MNKANERDLSKEGYTETEIWVSNDVWKKFEKICEEMGLDETDALNEALCDYFEGLKKK